MPPVLETNSIKDPTEDEVADVYIRVYAISLSVIRSVMTWCVE